VANTPVLGLPFPTEDDQPAGHAQIQALAEKLEQLLTQPQHDIGDLKFAAVRTEHSQWIIADGRALTSVQYPQLRTMLINDGNRFGVSGANPLIPDLRGRTAIGPSATRAHGSKGGVESVAITTTQMPYHNHGGATGWMDRNNPHGHYYGDVFPDGGQADGPYYAPIHGSVPVIDLQVGHISGVVTSDINHLHAVAAEGGSGAHENMSPYQVGTWFIYAGPPS
jgi:microcystin-dependent protein